MCTDYAIRIWVLLWKKARKHLHENFQNPINTKKENAFFERERESLVLPLEDSHSDKVITHAPPFNILSLPLKVSYLTYFLASPKSSLPLSLYLVPEPNKEPSTTQADENSRRAKYLHITEQGC